MHYGSNGRPPPEKMYRILLSVEDSRRNLSVKVTLEICQENGEYRHTMYPSCHKDLNPKHNHRRKKDESSCEYS
jgi:hypothetical protein